MQWREWSGYFASSVYADHHDIEYNAIREAAALIDVSPLFKYEVSGPDALRLVDRVITRDASRLRVGQVVYTPWCDEASRVIDGGTVHRLARTALDDASRSSAGLPERPRPRPRSRTRASAPPPSPRGALPGRPRRRPGGFADLRYFRAQSCTGLVAATGSSWFAW
jgi:hypothetical protein